MKLKKDPTQKRIKELLNYNPETGVWRRKSTKGGRVNGSVAGFITSYGYRHVSIDGNDYVSGRLAFMYMKGYYPENDVDHMNRIRHDDRWCNLREVSRQCNTRNCNVYSNSASGITGVRFRKRNKRWIARIRVSGKLHNLGSYENKIDAVKARHNAEIKYNWPSCNSTSSVYLYLKERGLIND